jgi:hypothetical protein
MAAGSGLVSKLHQLFPLVDSPEFFRLDVLEKESGDPSPSAAKVENGFTVRHGLVELLDERPEEPVDRERAPESFIARQACDSHLKVFRRQRRQDAVKPLVLPISLRIEPQPEVIAHISEQVARRPRRQCGKESFQFGSMVIVA